MFNYILGKEYNERVLNILSDISLELSTKEPWYIEIINKIGLPIFIAIITSLITIHLTNMKEKEIVKKKEYISSIRLFKDIHQGIAGLILEIESNEEFLNFLYEYSNEINELYIARKMIDSNLPDEKNNAIATLSKYSKILNRHNDYLKAISIYENSISNRVNDYSNLLYDLSSLLKTEEIDAIIKYYNNVSLFIDYKNELKLPDTNPEKLKFYLLDIRLLYEGNQYSIVNDTDLKSAYETLYKVSGMHRVENFDKLDFKKIIINPD